MLRVSNAHTVRHIHRGMCLQSVRLDHIWSNCAALCDGIGKRMECAYNIQWEPICESLGHKLGNIHETTIWCDAGGRGDPVSCTDSHFPIDRKRRDDYII